MSLNVGVIGAGTMGMNHLRVLSDFGPEHVRLVGIAEASEPILCKATSRFHVTGYTDYRKMIAETHPDLIAVVVPTNLHFKIASYVLDQGIHVLIEKPMTTTIEEASALLQLAHLRNVKIAIGHIERFNPAIIELKRHLMAGELGKLFQLHARRLGPFPPRIRDVGVILDLATHDVDIMRYLTNSEITQIHAETQRRIHSTCEDLLLGILRFADDVIGVLDVNWLTPTKIREITITGEKGMFLVNYLTQDITFYENDYTSVSWDALRSLKGVSEGTMTRFKVQKAEPLRLEYEDVLAAILNNTPPTVTGEDGLATLLVAHRLLAAASESASIKQREVQYAHNYI
jgi:UDP-N-acetylglucosamine 3-dehydrogenase